MLTSTALDLLNTNSQPELGYVMNMIFQIETANVKHCMLRFRQWQLGYRRHGASDGVQSRDR